MRRRVSPWLLVGALALIATGSAGAATVTFVIPMSGTLEAPGPGDPDGTGTATLMINDVTLTIDWTFTVQNIILPLTGAHIHQAPAGVAGPVRVDFSAMLSGTGLADPDLAQVLAAPWNFYVNLHNAVYPAGAIRGQVSAIPEPGTLLLIGGALTVIGALRLRARR